MLEPGAPRTMHAKKVLCSAKYANVMNVDGVALVRLLLQAVDAVNAVFGREGAGGTDSAIRRGGAAVGRAGEVGLFHLAFSVLVEESGWGGMLVSGHEMDRWGKMYFE